MTVALLSCFVWLPVQSDWEFIYFHSWEFAVSFFFFFLNSTFSSLRSLGLSSMPQRIPLKLPNFSYSCFYCVWCTSFASSLLEIITLAPKVAVFLTSSRTRLCTGSFSLLEKKKKGRMRKWVRFFIILAVMTTEEILEQTGEDEKQWTVWFFFTHLRHQVLQLHTDRNQPPLTIVW